MASPKKRRSQEQKLRDAVADAASNLKEAGEPLVGLGPNQRYVVAFERYGKALKDLLQHECPLHIADWCWDGYEGTFTFYWEFGGQLAQPGLTIPFRSTRFVAARCAALLDPQQPLDEELARLRAEAEHYDELRSAMIRWAHERHTSTKELP